MALFGENGMGLAGDGCGEILSGRGDGEFIRSARVCRRRSGFWALVELRIPLGRDLVDKRCAKPSGEYR